MKLTEVKDAAGRELFHRVPKILYADDPHWVCPLDSEIDAIFNPAENKLFREGDAVRWILQDDRGILIGRVAAFFNKGKASQHDQPTGGTGFFECIHDREAARILFDACKNWLKERGMEAMDGPITFGENLNHWGLLTEGFTTPVYGMSNHFPYYRELFEGYGFKVFYEQYSYEKDLSKPFPDRQVKFSMHLKDKFRTEHFTFREKERFLKDACTIYNKVWADFHENYTPLEYEDLDKMITTAKPILNEEFIWFVYDNDVPAAMVVVFPDVNQILKKLGNGKMNAVNMLKFLWYKNTGAITRARQLLTAVTPEYQRSGVTGLLFLTMVDALIRNKIKVLDMSWVGDYNVTVNKIYRLLDLPVVRKHTTFRYMFDPAKEVVRFTNEHTEKHKRVLGE